MHLGLMIFYCLFMSTISSIFQMNSHQYISNMASFNVRKRYFSNGLFVFTASLQFPNLILRDSNHFKQSARIHQLFPDVDLIL